MDPKPETSVTYEIKPKRSRNYDRFVGAVVAGAAVALYYSNKTTTVRCYITPEQVKQIAEDADSCIKWVVGNHRVLVRMTPSS
jgi:hypothetical protein